MATSAIVGVEVDAIVTDGKITRTISMSLQRHHYRYCAGAGAAVVNSLLYASVTDPTILAEAVEVGTQIENVLTKGGGIKALFGKDLTVASGRVYLVDNSALDPSGAPNHFFVKSGVALWDAMTSDEFVAARAIRLVEEAIGRRQARKDGVNYVDPKQLQALRSSPGGAGNEVLDAYFKAHPLLTAVPDADAKLGVVSGRADIVGCARRLF